jgi:DNA-binding winged helix-turn-helix (wHTH) protein
LWADEPPDGDALRSHLYKLRQAIDRPFDNPLIQTVHRIGYRIAEAGNAEPNVAEDSL